MTSDNYSALVWTPELVGKFWAYQTEVRPDSYFALRFGSGIVDAARKYCESGGRVLDYGCGPGFLLDHLKTEFRFAGYDTTAASVAKARARLGTEPNLVGLYSGDEMPPEDSFDVVFLVETIEHVPQELFLSIGQQLVRFLRPGGRLVVTTPNNEDLSASTTFCPCCEQTFHIWQHVRSFDTPKLERELRSLGLIIEETIETDFGLSKSLRSLPRRWARAALGRKAPHLMCVGRKG